MKFDWIEYFYLAEELAKAKDNVPIAQSTLMIEADLRTAVIRNISGGAKPGGW